VVIFKGCESLIPRTVHTSKLCFGLGIRSGLKIPLNSDLEGFLFVLRVHSMQKILNSGFKLLFMDDQPEGQQCIFCQIIGGAVPCKKIYEDELCLGILDINPANAGHILLMPKQHAAILPQVSDDVIAHLGMVAKGLSAKMLQALSGQGVSVFIANGVVAGQRAPHFLIHVIPRFENDGVGLVLPENKLPKEEFDKLYGVMSAMMAKVFGSSPKKPAEKPASKDAALDDITKMLLEK
jgi:histidine triad (HIT) family protein